MSSPASHRAIKKTVVRRLAALAEASPAETDRRVGDTYHPHAEWRGSHPMNEVSGADAIARAIWMPLLASFPDLERRDAIVIGGGYEGSDFVAAVGHYCGTFTRDWLTIPATGRPIYLRYGEVHKVVAGKIAQSTVLIDVLDVIRQAGVWPIAPSLGVEAQWPGPITGDGTLMAEADPTLSTASLAQALAMQATLGAYDDEARQGRDGLLAMPQKDHWHPKMMWYGPCGIGTTRGLSGFVDDHQLPFRLAFPNRLGGQHYIRIGDGAYSATGGWPSVRARHLGGNFLGTAPTGREVGMRVMDFYLHHEGLIRENWVPIDIVHLLLQMDVDVFGRMHQLLRPRGPNA